jgi:hypothetical protein
MMRMMRLGLHLWQRMIEFLLFYCVFVVFFRHLISLFAMLKIFDLYYSVYPGPSKTIRGSNFYCSVFFITLFYPLSLL